MCVCRGGGAGGAEQGDENRSWWNHILAKLYQSPLLSRKGNKTQAQITRRQSGRRETGRKHSYRACSAWHYFWGGASPLSPLLGWAECVISGGTLSPEWAQGWGRRTGTTEIPSVQQEMMWCLWKLKGRWTTGLCQSNLWSEDRKFVYTLRRFNFGAIWLFRGGGTQHSGFEMVLLWHALSRPSSRLEIPSWSAVSATRILHQETSILVGF